jgi:hypothetical protein
MVDRLDEERIEILRGWGLGLASDDREELRAAGKAITVLIDEIDRLQVDLWNARAVELNPAERNGGPEPAERNREPEPAERDREPEREPLVTTTQGTALRDRLARIRPQL